MKALRVWDKPPPGMLSYIGPIIDANRGGILLGLDDWENIQKSTVPPFLTQF